MRPLRDLLTTWENWSTRNTLTRALRRVDTNDVREVVLRRGLAETPEVTPLDALRDAAELMTLLSGWQWQAMYAARLDETSWDEIGANIGTSGEDARHRFIDALDQQEVVLSGSTIGYRDVANQAVTSPKTVTDAPCWASYR